MEFDSTITFSLLLTLIAFVSPIITALINNDHNLKLKKLDMYEQSKRDSLENFINSVSSVLACPNPENFNTYICYLNKLYIYFSVKKINFLPLTNKLEQFESKDDSRQIQKLLNDITVILSKQIKKK